MSMIRPLAIVGALLVVAGCAPAVVRGAAETASGPPPPRVPVLKPVDPCSLIKPDEAASIDLPAGTPDRLADLRYCKFNGAPEEMRELKGSLLLDEGPGKGADDLRPPPGADEAAITKETVATYEATVFPYVYRQDYQQCMITIDVNTDENVTVQTSFRGTSPPALVCEVARKMVKFIAPRLPKK